MLSCPSHSLCIRPLSLFSQPLVLVAYSYMHVLGNCHNEDSCKHVSEWLSDCAKLGVHDCVCVCVCVGGGCLHVNLAALHVLWSVLSFLPLMLFPVVSKLPHLCTVLSCLLLSYHRCLKGRCVGLRKIFIIIFFWNKESSCSVYLRHSKSSPVFL